MSNLDAISTKNLNEMERLTRELMAVIRKSKLENEALVEALRQFEIEVGNLRRVRFDAANPEYHAY
jgi:hypothetical protein